MANIIESQVTLEDEVFEETIDVAEEPIEVVRPSSYNDLQDLPQVNGVTLMGNKTSEELGIVTTTDIENAVSAEATLRENADTALGGRIDGEKTARENADTALGGRIDGEITNRTNADNALGTRIDNEILARQGGDNNLQTQIDAITSKSDVVDVVADYAALQAYDTQHLGDNDVVKVLDDETHDDAQTYYRWNKTAGTWSYIGSEAPYYSKGQIDQQMQAKQDKLTAGTGITLDGSTISADTTVLATKEDLEPEIVADLPTVGDTTKLYLTPTNKTASGNPITIDLKEDVGQMTSFRLDGDTYQQSYTGKNLFPSSVTWTINRAFPNSAQGEWANWAGYYGFLDYIEVEPDTTYTFSNAEHLKFIYGLQYYDSDKNWISGTNDVQTFTTPSNCHYIRGAVSSNTAPTQCQLELGSTATTYEPYVGGQPSPNPDYPQAIQTVTGEQTVEIVGKNLFNGIFRQGNQLNTNANKRVFSQGDGIYLKTGDTITLSTDLNTTAKDYAIYLASIPYPVGDAQYIIYNSGYKQTPSFTYTATADGYLGFTVRKRDETNIVPSDLDGVHFQIELGSTPSTYTPYSKQTLPISLGSIELCKLGTYQDYIYKSGDDWKVHKATGKYVYNNDLGENGIGSTYVAMQTPTLPTIPNMEFTDGRFWCNSYTPVMQNNTGLQGTNAASRIRVNTSLDIADSYAAVRALADANNLTIYYPLATPTDTTITDQTLIAQLEAIRTASLENGANTITNTATGTNLAGSMSIGYYGYNPSEYSEWLYVDGAWEQVSGRPIPTKTSDLDNDSEFVTREEIAPKLQTEVVSELPTVGDEGKLYLTPKNYTTGTATGNPITISLGEDAGQITSAQLDGDTYQQTYTGKNLLRLNDRTTTFGGVSITTTNGTVNLKGTATSYGQGYYVTINTTASEPMVFSTNKSGATSGLDIKLQYKRNGTAYYPSVGSSLSLQAGDIIQQMYLIISNGSVLDGSFSPMLEKGSTATSFEPFVGGVPSPNPDYPQAVQTVTGEQTIRICGLNIYDKSKDLVGYALTGDGVETALAAWHITDYIPVVGGETYIVTGMTTPGGTARTCYYDSAKNLIEAVPQQASPHTITPPSGSAYVRLSVYNNGNQHVFDSDRLQIELGSTAHNYEAYSGTDYPINLGSIELCKLGTYQDYIYKDGDDWKVHKATGKKTFSDGSSFFQSGRTTSSFLAIAVNLSELDSVSLANNSFAKATHFRFTGATVENGGMDIYNGSTYAQNFVCYFDKTAIPDLSTAQNWITVHNPQIVYVRYSATDTTITDQTLIAQLEAARNATLQASNTITNTATGSNLAGDMELGYCEYDPTNRYDKWLWLDLNNNYEQLGS